jgi:hypothetical protein
MKKLIALMTVFFFLFGCASTTIIKSKPSGAKVYLDGEIKGETPYTYTSAGIWGTKKMVVLKKEDYKESVQQIKKDQVNWVTVIIGALVFYPLLLWGADFPTEYTFEMEKLESKPSDQTTKPQLTPPSSSTTNIVTVIWTSANIRSGAGNEFPIVTTVKQGDRLTVIGEHREWFNVRLEDGKEGWINSGVVK